MSRKKRNVSLVLGSGGARGYAHIGVIEVLEESGFRIASISGASMGALVGGLYACGKMEEYKRWVMGLDALDVASLIDLSFSARGVMRGEKIFAKLREIMGEHRIEELPIRYTAVATDVNRKKEIWFQRGDLLEAIRASIAIPSIFTPVETEGMLLVDGGALNPLPVAPTMADRTDLIVAVNLYADVPVPKRGIDKPQKERQSGIERRVREMVRNFFGSDEERINMFDVLDKTFDTMQDALTRYRLGGYPPDIIVQMPMGVCNSFDFHKAEEVIAAGRTRAQETLAAYLKSG